MDILRRWCGPAIFVFILIQCMWAAPYRAGTDSFEVGKWVEKWVKSWNTYDLDQVDALFLQDDRVTYFSSEKEGVIIGIEAVRKHHAGFGFVPGGKEQPNRLWLEDLHTVGFDTSAVVTGIWVFQRPDGSRQRGPVTIVYVREDGRLRIAHMNFSSYKAEEK